MINVNKSKNPALKLRSISSAVESIGQAATEGQSNRIGSTSRSLIEKLELELQEVEKQLPVELGGRGKSGDFTSLNLGNSMPVNGQSNTNMSTNTLSIDTDPMMTSITPTDEHSILFQKIYRDIYLNDSVGGSAADMLSFLPYSNFSLGGLDDNAKIEADYMEIIERLGVRTLLPEMSLDYLVYGEHCSSLMYNPEQRILSDLMPHDPATLTVTPLPFYSQDPIITANFNSEVKVALASGSPRIERLKKMIGPKVFEQIAQGSLELEPMSTLFLARKTFSHWGRGTSWFRRIMPIYLIEKNLFRGTLIESARRQRGILHITLGDGDWEPLPADMEFATEMFMNADSDPLGAIIATRMGISTEEIRQGGEFWKVGDYQDQSMPTKLRALGVSESLLSADANYNTADAGMTVFVELMRTFRDNISRKFLIERLFPLISLIKGYTVTKSGRIRRNENLLQSLKPEDAMSQMQDGSRLLIPSIHWEKQLKPEGDSAHMEMMQTLSDKGVPIPLRVMAAAGGLNLYDLLKQEDEDLKLRKRLAAWQKQIAKLTPQEGGGGGGDDSESAAAALSRNAALKLSASTDPSGTTRSALLSSVPNKRRPSLLSRDWGDGLIYATSKTGKKKHIINQRTANQKVNAEIVKAAKRRR